MIKSIVEYWNEVIVPAWKWLKRHWKGYLMFVGLLYGGLWLYIKHTTNWIYDWNKELKKDEES